MSLHFKIYRNSPHPSEDLSKDTNRRGLDETKTWHTSEVANKPGSRVKGQMKTTEHVSHGAHDTTAFKSAVSPNSRNASRVMTGLSPHFQRQMWHRTLGTLNCWITDLGWELAVGTCSGNWGWEVGTCRLGSESVTDLQPGTGWQLRVKLDDNSHEKVIDVAVTEMLGKWAAVARHLH